MQAERSKVVVLRCLDTLEKALAANPSGFLVGSSVRPRPPGAPTARRPAPLLLGSD